MMKKLTTLLLAIVVAAGSAAALSGCGNKSYPTEKGATEILFYARNFEDWSNDHLYDLVYKFNSIMDDGIQIKMVYYEDAEYTQAIKSARDGNYAPDVYMVSYGNLAEEIKKGYPAPLNDLMPQSAFDDILDYIQEMVCYDGVYYAYPQLTEPSSLLFYRKDMLQTAGVTTNPAEWSWADLMAACAKIKPKINSRTQDVIGLPTGLALTWSTIGLQYNTAGYFPIDDNWEKCLLSSTVSNTENYQSENEYANLARLWWDLYGNGYVPAGNVSPTGYNDIIEGLCGDKIALTFAGSWSVAEIFNTYPDYVDKIGIAPIPTKTGSKEGPTATNGGWTYAISKSISAEHKAKAATFIKWLLIDDAARTSSYFDIARYSKAPVTKSVQNYIDSLSTSEYDAWRNVINDVAKNAIPEPLYPFDISAKFADVMAKISIDADASKNSTADSAISSLMSTAISNINSIISLNNLAGTNPKK